MLVLGQQSKLTMNNKVATGIWLVFIGLVFLLDNFHVIDFHFLQVLRFWPLLLVSIGLNLLLQNRPYSTYLTAGINILLCVFVFFKGIYPDKNANTNFESMIGNSVIIENTDDKDKSYSKTVRADYSSEVQEAKLTINGGAAKYRFVTKADSSNLFSGSTNASNMKLNLDKSGTTKTKLELNSSIKGNGKSNNLVELSLNEAPIWNFEFNVGAAAVEGDFKKLKIKRLELNSGASKMTLSLPTPTLGTTELEINTAASQVHLQIPKGVPCMVEYDSIISNNKLEDIEHKDGDVRKSTGYDQAANRYHIVISGAANSLTVVRY